jgi:hypothetical protein
MTHAEVAENSYALCDPHGNHRMLIWHPHIGRTKEQTITITPMGQEKVDVNVAAPTGRMYANQMVDHPIRALGLRRMRRAKSCRH